MSRSGAAVLVALVAVVGSAAAGLSVSVFGMQEDPFPHERHRGLFPLCTGCHEGVPLAELDRFYPAPESCNGCHDGVERERVAWFGPSVVADNVVFDHAQHDRELVAAGDPAQECAACHNVPGGVRMAVADSLQLATCWGCHAHRATDHQVDADCVTCHLPLAESGLDSRRIGALPTPTDHVTGAFLLFDHGRLADDDVGRCATCHTRERCVACHVDAGREAIVAMPAAPSGMELPPAVVHYAEPATHVDEGWLAGHGTQASLDRCGTCHTSNDCASCHLEPLPTAASTLLERSQVVAPGVGLTPRPPETHERAFFMQAHPSLSMGDEASCATCHREQFCVSCHDAPAGGGYHPAAFESRHAADAFGRDAECASCHEARVFCRACHEQVGLVGTGGRLGGGYHDGGPVWLLRHGQAARQSLESCASCHKQVDCVQCHGVLGAFKVSPHPSDFDAARAWSRSPRACLGCHLGNPTIGNEP